jgi:hypothetical protein
VRLLSAILLLALTGCATYVDRGPRVRVAVEAGDYATAATVAQNFAADEPKDALVWNLDAAASLRAQGQLKESSRLFEQVEAAFRAGGGASRLLGHRRDSRGVHQRLRRSLPPKPADRIYASTYQALNRLELGDLNGARVAMARLRFVQQAFGSGALYVKPKADDRYDVAKASQDERTRDGLGMIEENLAGLTAEGAYDDAFSHWLQGMFFLRLGQDASDRERARKELLAAAQLNPANEVFRRDLKDAEAVSSAGQGVIVYVVAETGMCPEWYQQRVDIPLFIVSSRVPYVSVALPAIRPAGLNYNLKLKLDSQDVALPLASRPGRAHRQALRGGASGHQGPGLHFRRGQGHGQLTPSTNRRRRPPVARTPAPAPCFGRSRPRSAPPSIRSAPPRRTSGTGRACPVRFSVAHIEARAGQKLSVPGHPEVSLTLPAGKVLLVSLKSTQENLPVVLRCTPLVP